MPDTTRFDNIDSIVKKLRELYEKYDTCKILLEQLDEEIEMLETALMYKYNVASRMNEIKNKKDWINNLKGVQMGLKQWVAIGLVFALIASILKQYTLWLVVAFISLIIIRWLADIFWWGRDNEKW